MAELCQDTPLSNRSRVARTGSFQIQFPPGFQRQEGHMTEKTAAEELEALVKSGTTPGVARVVHKIHAIDPEVEYDALLKHLDPDPTRMEYSAAYAYADAAESKARKALQLMAVARVEQKAFEFHRAKMESAMRKEGMVELQAEKDGGVRSKQITDADVRARMVENYSDEMESLERRGQQVTNAVDVTTDLAKLAATRCKTAQTMLSVVR